MNPNSETNFDLDNFYSNAPIAEWKQIIGNDLHYHFGYFKGSEDLETGLKQTVRNFFPYIDSGSKVLDTSCGWGGSAKMLIEERDCTVTGISFSQAQAAYCQSFGLNVSQQDLEQESDNIFAEHYDVVLSLETISHIRNKPSLIKKMRDCGSRLIISESCAADNYTGDRVTFDGSMVLCTVSELVEAVESAGWTIDFMQDRRIFSLWTVTLWKQNLDRVYGNDQPPGQLSSLRNLVEIVMRSPVGWCQSFPLIDIVAS